MPSTRRAASGRRAAFIGEASKDEHGFDVESVARAGDRVEDMAYTGDHLVKFKKVLEKLLRRGELPKAISSGGNDVAGEEFFSAVTALSTSSTGPTIPILVHGYDRPVPDGRGFAGGWPFPGPWLRPGLNRKGFFTSSHNRTIVAQQKSADAIRKV